MSIKPMPIFILFLISVSFAAQAPLAQFLNKSFEPDQQVSAQPLLYGNGNFALVIADGAETYVVDSANGKAVQDKAQLQAMLAADARNKSGFDAKVSEVTLLDENLAALHSVTEAKCSLLTGTDMHECKDRDTCILACKSNPNCDIILYSDGFWEALLEWNVKKLEFDSRLSEYNATSSNVGADASAIDSSVTLADRLLFLATNMSKNTIFLNRTDAECQDKSARCFEYCPKVDYGIVQITASKSSLFSLKASLASVQLQPSRADAILSNGRQNDEYLATRNGKLQDFKNEIRNAIRILSEKKSQLSGKVSDPMFDIAISGISNLSVEITSLGDAGLYRAALAKKPDFDTAYSGASDRAASDLFSYGQLTGALDSLSGKINKSATIIGASSTATYNSQVSGLRAKLASPMSLSEISSANSKSEEINGRLNSEIAEKATSGSGTSAATGAQQPASQAPSSQKAALPCLPALAVLAVFGFVSIRRK